MCKVSLFAIATLSAFCLFACAEPRGGEEDHAYSPCTGCHGSPTRAGSEVLRAAPPMDLGGNTDPSFRGVGAHAIHLSASAAHGAAACTECHVVPARVDDPGHLDGKSAVVFSGVATSEGAAPSFDASAMTCSETWCHGAGSPAWTHHESPLACTGCHGAPPPLPHPQMTQCSFCHGAVVGADDRTIVNPQLHLNGVVDVSVSQPCDTCHTSEVVPAPPHERHKQPAMGRIVACPECHLVKLDDPGHLDGQSNGGVSFSGVATSNGAAPSWDPPSKTCRHTWCHGPGSPGTSSSPVWANTATPLACTECHGMPPPLPHPQLVRCSPCHGAVIGPDDKTIIAADLHVNGVVDVIVSQACNGGCHGSPPPPPHPQSARCSLCHGAVVGPDEKTINPSLHPNGVVDVSVPTTCDGCHGSASSPAPPPDTHRNTDRSASGVGAHQTHLAPAFARATPCTECHVVPASALDSGHIDGKSDPVFSGVASTNGTEPSWDPSSMTCSGTWCHGLGSPTASSPAWTTTAPLGCNGCHGSPPPPPHAQMDRCSLCHGSVVGPDDHTIVDSSLHINGVVDVSVPQACNGCHGDARSPAPPPDLGGRTDPSQPGVGAHQKHLAATIARSVACSECHVVPTSVDAPGHMDGKTDLTVSFDPSTLTCADTWCHGSKSPAWTAKGPLGCSSCHGYPPPAPHPQLAECSLCHAAVVMPDNQTIADPALHVNGVVDVQPCNSCHGSSSSPAPPPDLSGNMDASARGVGAHQKHLSTTAARAVQCADCHVVPTAVAQPGHLGSPPAPVQFSWVASNNGQTPTWDGTTCANTYCHDPVVGTTQRSGGSLTAPAWTQPLQTYCGSCHGLPPPAPHPQPGPTGTPCSQCHSNIDGSMNFIDPSKHVNGVIDF